MFFSVLTGCGLVSRNDKNYYEAIVATITYTDGTKDNITKRELLTAYSSYGYNYVQNYGYTTKKAIETTLESVIDSYITRRAVVDHYKNAHEDLFNDNETTYLWDKTYAAVLSNLRGYLEGYKSSSEDNSTSDQNSSIFVDYTSSVKLIDGVIRKNTPATTIRDTYEARYVEGHAYDLDYLKDGEYVFKELMYDRLNELTTLGDTQSKRDWNNAFTKYISVIKENYTYYTKTNKEWMLFEIDRVYEILKNNYIAEKYEVIYNRQAYQDEDTSLVQVQDVVEKYAEKVRVDYTTYMAQNQVSTFENDVLNSIANVDYVLDNGSQYFFVAPIKINLLDSDKTDLEELESKLAAGLITPEAYERSVAQIVDTNRNLVSVRNATTGEVESTMSVQTLADRLTSTNISVEEYRKYFYLYNDEDTYKNADFNAVFGIDGSGNVLANSTYTNDNIKTAIAALYDNGNAQVGDTSTLVQVDDGWYIFFYAGKVENLFDGITKDFTLNANQIATLANAKLNVFSSKTVFDVVFSEISASGDFASFQNENMHNLRSNTTTDIKMFNKNIKDLYK